MFDNEPWYITEFGGKQETVTVPKDIKTWYGSHAALPEVNYGELGRIASRNDEGTVAELSQTLIIPSGCNLTMVNMKLHSDVKVIVQEGAKLTLRQTTVDGVIRKGNNTYAKKDFTVTIYNGESDTPKIVECSESKIIKNIAEKVDGKNFAYWTLDGTVFSYNSKIAYRADNTGILKAVYTKDAVEASGTANIRKAKYSASERKLTFNAYLTVPDNCKIVSAGLVSAFAKNFDPANAELTAENADYSKSLAAAVGKSVPVSYTWNKSNVYPGDIWYARAYLVYTIDGIEHTVYGSLTEIKA